MILRRLVETVREQSWFTVALEIFIVVIGIFLGLQVDDWNERRKEQSVAAAYHARLLEDVRTELVTLDLRIEYYTQVRQRAEDVRRSLSDSQSNFGEQFLIDLYLATNVRDYRETSDTYDELISTGALNLIPDTKLRAVLARYYRQTKAMIPYWRFQTEYRELVRQHMPADIQRRIRTACVLWSQSEAELWVTRLASECSPGLSSDDVQRALDLIFGSPTLGVEKLHIAANRLIADLDNKIIIFERKRASAIRLIDIMEGAS